MSTFFRQNMTFGYIFNLILQLIAAICSSNRVFGELIPGGSLQEIASADLFVDNAGGTFSSAIKNIFCGGSKMKRFWKGLAAIGVVASMCVPVIACGNDNAAKTEQEKVYAAYVAYAEATGDEVLSYEAWLETVRGPQGEQGIQGEKGDKGDTGAQGEQGAKGEKGDKGDTGAQGEQGAKGEKGDKGDTGAQGEQGAKGEKGDKGDTGAQGEQGAKGEKGDKGDTGAQGEQGAKGEKGDKGDTGAQGEQGAKGEKGDKGDTGAQGEQGDPGKDGKDGEVGRIGFMVRTAEELSVVAGIDNTYIVLMNDVDLGNKSITITKNVVLDLGGHTLKSTATKVINVSGNATVKNGTVIGDGDYGVFYATAGKLTIENVNVVAIESADRFAMAVWATGTATIDIYGGEFTQTITGSDSQYDMIYADKSAQINIYGGTFKCHTPSWTLNLKNGDAAKIVVYGGTFYGFDPAAERQNDNVDKLDNITVADGYVSVKADDADYWTVSKS